MSLQTAIVGIPLDVRNTLEKAFTVDQLQKLPSSWDKNKMLTYVMPEPVIRRLNEAFQSAWSFEIFWQSITWNTGAHRVTVVVRISAPVMVQDPAGAYHVVMVSKDGVGSAELKSGNGNGGYLDIGFDLKSAVTDGVKLAAKLFGVGLDLYENKGEPSPGVAMAGKALQNQLDTICKWFDECGVTKDEICAVYGLKCVEDMPMELAVSILDGQEVNSAQLGRNCNNPINKKPLTASQA